MLEKETDLYPHQEEALKKLSPGKVLCGGVGSGKSRTALYFYAQQYDPAKRPLYIITTARKRDTKEWEEELKLFSLPEGCIIDSWNNIKKYLDVENAFFIFDEQRVVGSGVWARSFLKIAKRNEWIMLSATPGDTWMDYWAIFVANGFYRNKTDFTTRHVVWKPYSRYPQVARYAGTSVLEKRRKSILVTMPMQRETVRNDIPVDVDYNKIFLDVVVKERWDPFKNEPIMNTSRMGYCARRVVNSDESRLEAVKTILEEHNKAIIFYNFDFELEILRSLDGYEGLVTAEWNGHKHEPIPDGDLWVYLVQYTSGAEGWNCTQTDTMIFYSQTYSWKVLEQAEGRIDRLNTPYTNLYYYHLRSSSKVDQGILTALTAKKKFNEKIFYEPYFQ